MRIFFLHIHRRKTQISNIIKYHTKIKRIFFIKFLCRNLLRYVFIFGISFKRVRAQTENKHGTTAKRYMYRESDRTKTQSEQKGDSYREQWKQQQRQQSRENKNMTNNK